MEMLTEGQATLIIEDALADRLPQAEEITKNDLCKDCEEKTEYCFPCRTAEVITEVYLFAIINQRAKLN